MGAVRDARPPTSFTIDACAVRSNTKHPRFWSPKEKRAHAQSWEGETVFCNPPYGEQLPVGLANSRLRAMGALSRASCSRPCWHVMVARARHAGVDATRVADSVALGTNRTARCIGTGGRSLIVGVHIYPERVLFDGMEDGAPFDTALVVMASPKPQATGRRPSSWATSIFRKRWPDAFLEICCASCTN